MLQVCPQARLSKVLARSRWQRLQDRFAGQNPGNNPLSPVDEGRNRCCEGIDKER